MLPKSHRFNLKTGFGWIIKGKRYESDYFKLFYRMGENETPLIGVAISAKFFKRSIERNKVKRIVFRATEPIYPLLQSNLNLVIMPNIKALSVNPREIERELKNVKDIFRDN